MKRIIFSIFNDSVDQNHKSTNDYKLNQFRKYRHQLESAQRAYAKKCGSDYVLHETNITDYNSIQFEKIFLLEEYADQYDEIVYLDFDVVPTAKAPNIFETIDFNTIAIHPLIRSPDRKELRSALDFGWFDTMNVYCKTCAKNAMLLLDDMRGTDKVYNTGVVAGGKEVIKQLRFKDQLQDMKDLLVEATEDSVYPEEITKNFYFNNEVFITYLIERNNIPYTDLSMAWNFILDGYCPDISDAAYFVHHVNKEFEKSFG